MRLSVRTTAWIALGVELVAFLRCAEEYLRLSFFVSTATKLLQSAQPFLLGALAALGYGLASLALYRKGKFLLSASLAVVMVVVLVVLKFAYR
jgi:hypothetical protein